MTQESRSRILKTLKQAPAQPVPENPDLPPPGVAAMDPAALAEAFCARFTEQTGIVYRAATGADVPELLVEVFREHDLTTAVASADSVITSLELVQRGRQAGLDLASQADFPGREAFRAAVFEKADAGITGADFGVAETGSLVLSFGKNHARLISLAPRAHIALLPVERIVGNYEAALDALYREGKKPSQTALITGPSMTGDIQGKLFRGMHGPQKLIAVLISELV